MRRGRASLEAFLVVMAAGTASLPAPSRTGRLAAVPAHPPIALVFGPLTLLPYAGYEPRQSLGIYSRIALSYAQKEYQAGHRAVPPLTISGTTGGGDSRSSGCRVTSPTAETDTLVSLSPRPNWELCRFQNRKLQSSGGARHRRYRKLQQDWQFRVRERQNADLGLNNMYVVSVLAHAEFALNPRRQEQSYWRGLEAGTCSAANRQNCWIWNPEGSRGT